MSETVEMIITSRERDLGGFTVRRILPYATHRMVGPYIFFDHMGPAEFKPGEGMDVRPHPHINLATVSYLFEGSIYHKDSLGSGQLIEPGAINWMTAGRGIVHSERTPEEKRQSGMKLSGIQLWVALPVEHEETDPSFTHYPKELLPEFKVGSTFIKLLVGALFGKTSPVKIHSDLFYAEARIKKGETLNFDVGGRESAAYVVEGSVKVDERSAGPFSMIVAKGTSNLHVTALEDSKVMLLGGSSVGPRKIFWNFVSSSEQRIEEGKREWAKGPGNSARFGLIPGDDQEFIPLPAEAPKNPKGTIM
jgi:redox-sensitive bicupin YhaK (pirin superfamily)